MYPSHVVVVIVVNDILVEQSNDDILMAKAKIFVRLQKVLYIVDV